MILDMTDARFQPGQLLRTPGTQGLTIAEIFRIHGEHVRVEQGEACDEDHQVNLAALKDGSRIFTVHKDDAGGSVWVISEASKTPADRSAHPTTILRPHEY
jgi:hypothetical protein